MHGDAARFVPEFPRRADGRRFPSEEMREMMLNHRPYQDWHEGLTVQGVIEHMKFTWPKLVVKINGKLIWPEQYGQAQLAEGDDLEIIHLLGGG